MKNRSLEPTPTQSGRRQMLAKIEAQFATGYAYLGQSHDGNHQGDAADIRFLLDQAAKTDVLVAALERMNNEFYGVHSDGCGIYDAIQSRPCDCGGEAVEAAMEALK